MDSTTLLIRHLPPALTVEEKVDFLKHFGAVRVRVIGTRGPLKNTVLAEFSSADIAKQVLAKLHQTEVLGCRLVVELAHSKAVQQCMSVEDLQSEDRKEDTEKKDSKEETAKKEQYTDVFDLSFLHWGTLQDEIAKQSSCKMLQTGSCGLHTIHNAFRAGSQAAGWGVDKFLSSLYYLFKDSPARREDFAVVTGSTTLPLMFCKHRLQYPRQRRLFYLYPPPSLSILTNISNALAACPRFYVQVLHLMNKMDLPAPFGTVSGTPPLALVAGHEELEGQHEIEDMVVSSTEESELESDSEQHRPQGKVVRKRKARVPERKSQIKKRAHLAMAMLQPSQHSLCLPRPAPTVPPLLEVFEQAGETSTHRKIQFLLPPSVREDTPAVSHSTADSLLPSHHIQSLTEQPVVVEKMKSVPPSVESSQSSGFGLIVPVPKVLQETQESQGQGKEWSVTTFISKIQLSKGRLSRREMGELAIFRNYQRGESSRRLYIKNLAKQVIEEDLHWIFGRYINWDDETEKNIFDIRLMKEGRMKGQAFITLATEEQAEQAVTDTNAFVLKGKPMAVMFARSAKLQEEGK